MTERRIELYKLHGQVVKEHDLVMIQGGSTFLTELGPPLVVGVVINVLPPDPVLPEYTVYRVNFYHVRTNGTIEPFMQDPQDVSAAMLLWLDNADMTPQDLAANLASGRIELVNLECVWCWHRWARPILRDRLGELELSPRRKEQALYRSFGHRCPKCSGLVDGIKKAS